MQRHVRVEGEVKLPGDYQLASKDERVSDVVNRAGGLTQYAGFLPALILFLLIVALVATVWA